ncbi:MAG: enoyl-CoA hydratase-related protein [Bacteroidota bacterium]|nr:enoyl-CoA hydratase-related protein [Bacteroidota bacterium]
MDYIKINPAVGKSVGHIQINRPNELNALNLQVMQEIASGLKQLDEDETVNAIIISGNEKAFAAGADIKEMAGRSAVDMVKIDQFSTWEQIKKIKKPLIAAVSGFALGGGCELAMACDMIIASETAQFGQPEIKIGVMPGAGGTQRLTRALGKARAMEMVLTGKFISVEEALSYGLINKIVPVALYLSEAIKFAEVIASMPPLACQLAKESVNRSYETHLDEGLHFERKNFNLLFASSDQKEGMNAFMEKRKPNFSGK